MRISILWILKKYYLYVLVLLLTSTNSFAQNWNSGWVYIENVKTGLVMDVQNDIKANGTNVWPYSLNYGRAQMYRFSRTDIPERYGDDARYIGAYHNSGLSLKHYLSAKTPPLVIVDSGPNEPIVPGTIRPELILAPTASVATTGHPVSNKKTLKNFAFSIEEKHEINESSISPISAISELSVSAEGTPKQIWNILPVPNETDTYFIQNADFSEKMVVEPLDFSSGGTLVLSSFTGSDIQKWRILKTAPPAALNLELSDFEWEEKLIQKPWYKPWKWHHVQKIKGKLTWGYPIGSVRAKQKIEIDANGTDYETINLGPDKVSKEFNITSNKSAKTEEHCFSIRTYSKWIAQNSSSSDSKCKKPAYEDRSTTPPRPSPGISKLIVSNCHSANRSVRLWTYDFTINNGVWENHGTLGSQWQGSGCPFGSPKEIDLSDDHTYRFVAIDCGDNPPNQTQGSCHRLTSSQIQGDANGTSVNFQIN